jgi:hypothetical protein
MIRLIAIVALAFAVVGAANAARTIDYEEGAYEVKLIDLVLPGNASGKLSVRTCDSCERISLQVNANTTYSFRGGKPMPLSDFQLAITQLRQKPGASANGVVFYNLATQRVTRVVLNPTS